MKSSLDAVLSEIKGTETDFELDQKAEVLGYGNTKRAQQMRVVNQLVQKHVGSKPTPIIDIIYEGKSRKEKRPDGGSKLYLNHSVVKDILEDSSKAEQTIKRLL